MASSTHTHPRPLIDRITQYGALVLMVLILIAVPLQVLLALLITPGGLFLIGSGVTLLLLPFLLMLTVATPPVTVSANGLQIDPLIWGSQIVTWDDVQAVKDYPLLPSADAEVGRKLMVGRKKYRVAQGIMLIIPALPRRYRVTGFFTGEGNTPVIALTNRTHTGYEALLRQVFTHLPDEVTNEVEESS